MDAGLTLENLSWTQTTEPGEPVKARAKSVESADAGLPT